MKKVGLIFALICTGFSFVNAQNEEVGNVEVNVVDQYKANIKEAVKISNQPGFVDTTTIKLPVQYGIKPQMLSFKYHPEVLQPMRVGRIRLGKLPQNMVRLGARNYGTALAEIVLSNSRSKTFNWDLDIRHFSSQKGVKDVAYDKTPYMINEVKLGGRWILKNYRLDAKAGLDWNSHSYYGIPNTAEDVGVVIPDIQKNAFQRYFGAVNVDRVFKGKKAIFQKAGINYHYFTNNWETNEQLISGTSYWRLPQEVKSHLLGAELNVDWQSTQMGVNNFDRNQLNVKFFPKAMGRYMGVNYTLGLNLNFYNSSESLAGTEESGFITYLFPEIALEAELVKNVLFAFGGWTGDVTVNGIYNLTKTNPFLLPETGITPTALNKVYGGLEGAIAKNISYKLEGGVNFVRSLPLFFRSGDSLTVPYNGENLPAFETVFVRGNFVYARGEITYNRKNTSINGYGEYFEYNLYKNNSGDLENAYHLPTLKIGVDAMQKLKEKFEVRAGVAFVGGRKALDADGQFYKAKMKNIVDVNLGIGYNVNNNFSARLDFANLLSQEYEIWLGYPSQRFRVMLSLMYVF